VKKFGAVAIAIEDAIKSYAEDVLDRRFPAEEHAYAMKDEADATAPRSQVTKKPKKFSS
jgi:3-methyl-2-oxobutanoate hydroxymethyltransferase